MPTQRIELMNGVTPRRRRTDGKGLRLALGDLERMSKQELSDHLLELAALCPIDLPRYCCPIVEFRRLGSEEIVQWIETLHFRDKLALVARHYGCARWNQRD